jgi:hypothetical protein
MRVGSDRLQLVTATGNTICRVKQVKPEHLRGRTLLLREQGSSTRAGAERLLGERVKEFERVLGSRALKRSNRRWPQGSALPCFHCGQLGWKSRPDCFSLSAIRFCGKRAGSSS